MNAFDKIKVSTEKLTVLKVYSDGNNQSVIDDAFAKWKEEQLSKIGKPIEWDLE